ncbi:hypothetical protein Aab01nite_29670 [Paractinoplanes abujensis]|uniref:Uncharacterized protein n=1 Tax=Paractinoplanes abujensis TaxID=882441 RepID=A0A7W7D3H9_9ACTN|nr:hypothetical protein [Actinoplanes abujensis]MBB4698136.1 hypothetical protein [Actinoplanes abujensis]GID19377.1 hypothetical protein Aab01nite_29670 [Actinoplanes abujensis]
MSISGLGTARTPQPPLTPVHRTARTEKPAERADAVLTGRDRELIFQVTGERDAAKQSATAFAMILSAERAAGRLAPGQEAGALYLKDLSRRYERTGGPNPVAAFLPKALAYLGEGGANRIDVSA